MRFPTGLGIVPGPRFAISSLFLMLGLLAGSWFTRIPAVMAKHDLDTGQIGLLLLCFSLGALTIFQVIGRVIARLGNSRVIDIAGTAMCGFLVLLAVAWSPLMLAITLFVTGLAFGSPNVAINTKGVTIEKHLGTRIMGSLHGCFTAGMLAGSLLASLAARAGIGPAPHFTVMAVFGFAVLAFARGGLLADRVTTDPRDDPGRRVVLPRSLWPLGALAFCASVSEGAMYDWSALYVDRSLDGGESTGALAFAAFSLAVLVGRFGGDRLVDQIGAANVVRMGSAVAGAGLLAGLLVDSIPAAVGGFAALGLGVSVLTPLFYSAAGSREGVSSAQAVAAVATCGMLGLLAGPPLLGNLADITSLRLALAMVAIPCVTMILLASNVESRPAAMPSASPVTTA